MPGAGPLVCGEGVVGHVPEYSRVWIYSEELHWQPSS